jgi:hypothetical protein
LHPNAAEIYRRKVADLELALNDDSIKAEAGEILRADRPGRSDPGGKIGLHSARYPLQESARGSYSTSGVLLDRQTPQPSQPLGDSLMDSWEAFRDVASTLQRRLLD